MVELSFVTTAPIKQLIIHFNGLNKMIANVMGTKITLIDTDVMLEFAVSSPSFGSKLLK